MFFKSASANTSRGLLRAAIIVWIQMTTANNPEIQALGKNTANPH
ncbi:MAG: hypothetical protein BWY70_01887 [Bacteroidetes bacterium ADurb.Bin408]|nr:MAG: hypothetical protein BWY70_01887 [Bacteroidetes bacterium ADurb.Bin408]